MWCTHSTHIRTHARRHTHSESQSAGRAGLLYLPREQSGIQMQKRGQTAVTSPSPRRLLEGHQMLFEPQSHHPGVPGSQGPPRVPAPATAVDGVVLGPSLLEPQTCRLQVSASPLATHRDRLSLSELSSVCARAQERAPRVRACARRQRLCM